VLPRKRFAITVFAVSLMEWVLFELLRAPYRPPDDMLTFLGGPEKSAVMALMLLLATVGAGILSWWAARSVWSKSDLRLVVFEISIIASVLGFAVFCPPWSVTPFRLLFQ
jgi:hypothetical protein